MNNKDIILILPDIRSVHNVGTFFRTANALGINEIILTGITPTPFDKYGRLRTDFAKVSLGSEQQVKWRYVEDLRSELESFHVNKRAVISIEQSSRSIIYTKAPDIIKPITFIVGNEVDGIPLDILDISQYILEIPMQGNKESLNVTIAGAIVMSSIIHRQKE